MEERISRLERLAELQIEYNGNVAGLLDNTQGLLNNVVGLMDNVMDLQVRATELLEETRQDARMTRRLWVRLSQKYGWLDDDGLFEDDDNTSG